MKLDKCHGGLEVLITELLIWSAPELELIYPRRAHAAECEKYHACDCKHDLV